MTTTPHEDMEAYDTLPPRLREAVRGLPVNTSAVWWRDALVNGGSLMVGRALRAVTPPGYRPL